MQKRILMLALFATFLLSLNVIVGVWQTPKHMVYLGTVHHPPDYLFYLSEFAQGKSRWFTAIDLFTSEPTESTLVGMPNVFAGHVLSLFGLRPAVSYHITLTINTFLFFVASLYMLKSIFPKSPMSVFATFILFLVVTPLPGTGSFFANVTESLVRFARIPTLMLADFCIIVAGLCLTYWNRFKNRRIYRWLICISMSLFGLILANINPIQWVFTLCVLLATVGIYSVKKPADHAVHMFIPVLFFFAGFPMVLYMTHILKTPQFIQAVLWEQTQIIKLTIWDSILSFGPVALLALAGLPLFFKNPTIPKLFLGLYSLCSVAIFLSPAAEIGHITNTRFLSAITILGEVAITIHMVLLLPLKNKLVHSRILWIIIIGSCVLFIPVVLRQFQSHDFLNIYNSFIYTSKGSYDAMTEIERLTSSDDIIIVNTAFDEVFPAITGRHGFMGQPLATIHAAEKEQEAADFFSGKLNDAEMKNFLAQHGITHILHFTSAREFIRPYFRILYQNLELTLYKVSQ